MTFTGGRIDSLLDPPLDQSCRQNTASGAMTTLVAEIKGHSDYAPRTVAELHRARA
jgi:hypothetical protein